MKSVKLMGFKADGQSHRLWQRLYLGAEDEEKYIFYSLYPSITESNGRRWSNKEPTIYYCSKKHFYNILVMFRNDVSIAYYVNIATPTISLARPDEYGFIDMDLDVKLTENKTVRILDEDEFATNSKKYHYNPDLMQVSTNTVEEIKNMIKNNHPYFDDDYNRNLLKTFTAQYRKEIGSNK